MKVVLLGDSGVGKSSILLRMQQKAHNQNIESTMGCDFQALNIETTKGTPMKLHVWDTAGQEIFRSFTQNFLRNARVAIVCYDVTNAKSFASIDGWVDDTKSHTCAIILIANKCDLSDRRVISHQQGQEKADKINAYAFAEGSAFTGEGVKHIFVAAADAASLVQEHIELRLDLSEQKAPPRACCT